MDFRLKVFHSVATNLSFTKASKELFISQPAISKHIHELEVQYKLNSTCKCNRILINCSIGWEAISD